MKTALISVSDKTGLIPLATTLIEAGYEIISTGGTDRFLKENSINTYPVEKVTGFPEILDGRVKTLHPKIMGGILADTSNQEHIRQLDELFIERIDMVIVNLYPFEQVLAEQYVTHSEMIEYIDIGGVTLLRAAAKNYHSVTVISMVEDYQSIQDHLIAKKIFPEEMRLRLAVKAFKITCEYDGVISRYLKDMEGSTTKKDLIPFNGWRENKLRYGENPHQEGFMLTPSEETVIELLHGKELSYNNYLDIDAAMKLIIKFNDTTTAIAAIIKHTNPCGVAASKLLVEAYRKSFNTDRLSPFGGIVVVNKTIDLETAQAINEIFTEIIIAPDFEDRAFELLTKKKMRRLIRYDDADLETLKNSLSFVSCLNGALSQRIDFGYDSESEWRCVTKAMPTDRHNEDLSFAWKVVSALKSNAICIASEKQTIGMGMGQTSRIDSIDLAIRKAEKFDHSLSGSVCASDGFFPFRDSIDLLAEKGIKAIIQPGGSKGDEEVIAACNEKNIAMIFTGMRHFAH